ncbi:MAG: TolC family protein [Myxococcota bacterium]
MVVLLPSLGLAQPLAAFLDASRTRNVDARLAAEASSSARASFDQQWGGLLPTLSATGAYTRNQYDAVLSFGTSSITIVPRDQLDATLKAEVPLVDVSRWLKVSAASSSAEAAEAKESSTRTQVERQVISAWYAWGGAQRVLESARRSLLVSKAQVEQQLARKEAGVATELELERAAAEVERNTQLVADAEVLVENARRSLRTLSGLEPAGEAAFPVDDLHPEPALEELERRLEAQPSVLAAEREASAAAKSSLAAATALVPTVNAQFTERFTNATGFQGQSALWNAGVAFSWRADLGSVQGLRVASAAEQTARLTAEKVRQAAADQLLSDWLKVRAAITKVRAARAQVASARRAQALAKDRNAAGVATQLDVIQADRDLFAAEVNDTQAQLELANARASLRLSAGLPLEVTP